MRGTTKEHKILVEIVTLFIEHGAIVDDSLLRDHSLEMVGGFADGAAPITARGR